MEYLREQFASILESLHDDDRLDEDQEKDFEKFLEDNLTSMDYKKSINNFFELIDNFDLIDEDNENFFTNKKIEMMKTITIQGKLEIIDYSEKCIVLKGEITKKYKDFLKNMNGKYNPNLKGKDDLKFSGWVFSKNHKDKIDKFIVFVNSME